MTSLFQHTQFVSSFHDQVPVLTLIYPRIQLIFFQFEWCISAAIPPQVDRKYPGTTSSG